MFYLIIYLVFFSPPKVNNFFMPFKFLMTLVILLFRWYFDLERFYIFACQMKMAADWRVSFSCGFEVIFEPWL